jgi:hypothetical protein
MIKKILIIDQSFRTINLLDLIVSTYTNYNPIKESNKENIFNLLSNTDFEYIIIDHTIEYSNEIIMFILNKNSKQKVILLSDHIKCPLPCEDCVCTYNFVRLIKPVEPKSLLNYLNTSIDFLCPNKDRFSSINSLDKLFQFINLEDNVFYKTKELLKDKMIINASSGNININELSRIENLVNDSFFKILINNSNDIEVFIK